MSEEQKLNEEFPDLDALRREITSLPDPAPRAGADDRFAQLLAAQDGTSTAPPARTRHLRPAALLGIAASLLLLVFAMGWYFGSEHNRETDRRLAATRTLMLELMQDDQSTTRMRAATVSLDVDVADPEVIANLGLLLRTDENTNVRLAALDALLRFAAAPAARDELLKAMGGDPPPAVRAQLLETLVGLNEKRVLPYLRDLITNDSIPRQLRDAAELGTFKLI